jgi:Ca2+-binding EF-hand superfamily protein
MVHGINETEQQRYEAIFKKLDVNNNGKIDIHDLRDELGVSDHYAQVRKNNFSNSIELPSSLAT